MVAQSHRFCIAPMMEWTDRHCRYLHRCLTSRARLYTEMVTAEAVIRGDRERPQLGDVPGQSFHADRSGRNTMRLNFSNVPPDRIEEGIARLGRAIKRRLAASASDLPASESVPVSP